MINTQTGNQGFFWFFGRVVDVQDPEELGRVKILIYNEYRSETEQEDFRWAVPLLPVTSPSAVVGNVRAGATSNLVVGSTVFGFFADGPERQHIIVMGTLHTTPQYPLKTNQSIPVQAFERKQKPTITKNDPEDLANPQYPLNSVYTSPAGHVIEIDNTPTSQRVAVHHNTGSYIEIDNNGDIVIGSVRGARYSSAAETNVTAKGNIELGSEEGNVIVGANQTIRIQGRQHIDIVTPSGIRLQGGAGVTIQGGLLVEGGLIVQGAASGFFTSPTGQVVNVLGGIVTSIG
jgi:hypothetical protein